MGCAAALTSTLADSGSIAALIAAGAFVLLVLLLAIPLIKLGRTLDEATLIDWQTPFSSVLDYSQPPFAKWFGGGRTNLCHNAIDRHLAARGKQDALVWISTETNQEKSFTYEELLKRDKLNLDIFWLKDESLEDSANLPDPDIIGAEIVENLQAALAQFASA